MQTPPDVVVIPRDRHFRIECAPRSQESRSSISRPCSPTCSIRVRNSWTVRQTRFSGFGAAVRLSGSPLLRYLDIELDCRELFGGLAEFAQERQPARVGVEVGEHRVDGDRAEIEVVIFDRLV